jgi:hypothetical protein
MELLAGCLLTTVSWGLYVNPFHTVGRTDLEGTLQVTSSDPLIYKEG